MAENQRIENPPFGKRIVIIEDHAFMREGLAAWFSGTGRWRVTGTAATLAGAKELVTRTEADIALVDIQLEDGWGLDIIPLYTEQKDRPVIAVYSAYDDYPHVSAALSLGVKVYICKRQSVEELEAALLKALDGETCIDAAVQAKFETASGIVSQLTKREGRILGLITGGLTNQQIADKLGISRKTVENIACDIYNKTGIRSRLELQKL